MELHGQQHCPEHSPAEDGHAPAHPQQPHVPGSHHPLCVPLPPGGGLHLCLHHVLLHGRPACSCGDGREVWASAHHPAPQFYHACDQPGEAVLCILNYDTLQYCDFLGSGVSIWVTILCMARLKAALKYVSGLLTPGSGLWGSRSPCIWHIDRKTRKKVCLLPLEISNLSNDQSLSGRSLC